jgi:hypothetical protein
MNRIVRDVLPFGTGLIALGVAGVYLCQTLQHDRKASEALNVATRELERLDRRDPYPNVENIRAAQKEVSRLHEFLGEMQKHFASAPTPQELNNATFRTLLERARSTLVADASKAGVELPSDYWFTFGAQKGVMTFAQAALPALSAQVVDIGILSEVLFGARVNALSWMRRVPVESHDSLGSQDYLDAKPTTNKWATVMPYEVSFQAFSSELASILDALTRLPQCYIVTNLVVEPASANAGATEAAANQSRGIPRDQRYFPRMPMVPSPPPVARGPVTILDEHLLRITFSLQAVRPQAKS